MSLVEKELTLKNIERARNHSEFERRIETERKLVPINPDAFEQLYKAGSYPVEQIYLSAPNDEFSLRVRCSYRADGPVYSATQKDRGEVHSGALHRNEINTEISKDAFDYFAAMDLPRIRKLRADISDAVSIDFYDDPLYPVVVEIEHSDTSERARLTSELEEVTGSTLVDHSSNPELTTEAIAYKTSAVKNETLHTKESLDAFSERVLSEMIANYVSGRNQVVVGLTGMSGSGKSTVTNALQDRLVELFGESYRPTIISTDDYHFGKTALEARYGAPYSDWDSPKTYNTEALAHDLTLLANGVPITRRHFNFETEEPQLDELVEPSPFVVVEGLYAGSTDLDAVRTLHFELPTSIATSVGRDVRRLVIENRANRAFPTPESRLKYQIETALPLYLSQERPHPHSFSASVRPLGERAFMLARLTR